MGEEQTDHGVRNNGPRGKSNSQNEVPVFYPTSMNHVTATATTTANGIAVDVDWRSGDPLVVPSNDATRTRTGSSECTTSTIAINIARIAARFTYFATRDRRLVIFATKPCSCCCGTCCCCCCCTCCCGWYVGATCGWYVGTTCGRCSGGGARP